MQSRDKPSSSQDEGARIDALFVTRLQRLIRMRHAYRDDVNPLGLRLLDRAIHATFRQLSDSLLQLAVSVINAPFRALLRSHPQFLLRRGRGNNGQASGNGEIYGREPEATAGAEDERDLAGLDPRAAGIGEQHGRVASEKTGCALQVEPSRDVKGNRFRHDRDLGVGTIR